ncbi:MAG: hypothetical protein R3E87_00865 [Burkholderiaceae bacterium]
MNAVGALAVITGLMTLLSLLRLARRLDAWPHDEIRLGMFDGFRRQRDLAQSVLAALIAALCALLMLGEATARPAFGLLSWLAGAYLCTGASITYGLVAAAGVSQAKNLDPCWRALCLALFWPWVSARQQLAGDADTLT